MRRRHFLTQSALGAGALFVPSVLRGAVEAPDDFPHGYTSLDEIDRFGDELRCIARGCGCGEGRVWTV